MFISLAIALTSRSGCVAVNVPAPPNTLDSCGLSDDPLLESALSKPMIGTISVSLFGFDRLAAAPKCGASVGIRAIGQPSFTNLDYILPVLLSFTNTLPPMPRSRSHHVLFNAPA